MSVFFYFTDFKLRHSCYDSSTIVLPSRE